MIVWQILSLLIFCCLFSNCKNAVSPASYAQWVENPKNGLKKSATVNNYIFSLQYKPVEYMIAMQERTPEISQEKLEAGKDRMGDMQYFNFKLSTTSGEPAFTNKKLEFNDKSRYLISEMQKDIFLLEDADTLYCKLFHFENANSFLPYDNCVLAFDKNEESIKKNKTFLYRADKLGLDWIEITIKADDIERLPKLKTI